MMVAPIWLNSFMTVCDPWSDLKVTGCLKGKTKTFTYCASSYLFSYLLCIFVRACLKMGHDDEHNLLSLSIYKFNVIST